jgi:hypothetical protein
VRPQPAQNQPRLWQDPGRLFTCAEKRNAKRQDHRAHQGNLADLVADLEDAGLVEKAYTSWSDVSLALAAVFKADGRYPPEQSWGRLIVGSTALAEST